MSGADLTTITTPDGRFLEVLVSGTADDTVVFHSGTPSAAVEDRPLADAVHAHGMKLVTYSRPGYGDSTPHPGRTVASVAADVAAVLDAIGAGSFVVIGQSGGGPHALATAALLGGRCRAAASVSGVTPYDADGLDWLLGMGQENLDEFGAAVAGVDALTSYLDGLREVFGSVSGDQVADGLGDLVPDVDRAALTGEFADYVAASMRRALMHGVDGWRDDDLAFVRAWGFELVDISCPVSVWQGDQDRMVPATHGRWLADHLPGASAYLLADEGHLSLLTRWSDIVGWLAEQGA